MIKAPMINSSKKTTNVITGQIQKKDDMKINENFL
jgi:hypothetical protein